MLILVNLELGFAVNRLFLEVNRPKLVDKLKHGFRIDFTSSVKIKMHVLDLVKLANVEQVLESSSQHRFVFMVLLHEIQAKNATSIVVNVQALKMLNERPD